jgi:hypothetical protein
MVRSINNIINLFAKSLSANVWILLPAMAINSCDSIQTSQEISTSNSAVAVQIIKVSPMSAKPNETLSLSGTGFNTVKNPTVRLTMSDGSVKKTSVLVTSGTAASFVMPEGMGLGLKSATLMSGSIKEVSSFKLVADQMSNDLPILITDQSAVCNDTQYIDRNGDTQTGTKDCSAQSVKSCAVDGDSNCLVDGNTYKAAKLTNFDAAKILAGATVAGVVGTALQNPAGSFPNCSSDGATGCVAVAAYPAALAEGAASKILFGQRLAGVPGNVKLPAASDVKSGTTRYGAEGTQFLPSYLPDFPDVANVKTTDTVNGATGTLANCASDGAIGCVTVAGFKSADMSVAIAGNIKSGITIAGQLGDYPSVMYKLPRAAGATADLADLDNATFDIKVKSATPFEYWTSAGSYQTGAGDADITQANIKDTVSIFGTVGNYTGSGGAAPNAWDVRVGVTVNGVTGKLKVNCRNRVNSARFNYDKPLTFDIEIGQSQSVVVPPGTAIDIWDTIDDYNAGSTGLPPSIVTAWDSNTGSNTDCGGIDTPVSSSDDDNVWKDVTTTNGTTASTCAATSRNCTMQDKITGLWWSSQQQPNVAWDTAWSICFTILNDNTPKVGNSVAGYNGQTGWRLPTQKELLDAYNHGIRSAASNNWIIEVTEENLQINNFFWSGSSAYVSTNRAWYVSLANGYSDFNFKNFTGQVVCVR